MDQSELANLLEDSCISSQPEESQEEVEESTTEIFHGEDDSKSDGPSICEP